MPTREEPEGKGKPVKMRGDRLPRRMLLAKARVLGVVLLLSYGPGTGGCATYPVSAKHRVSREQAVMSGKGAAARLRFVNDTKVTGELIAATADTVWILTDQQKLDVYPISAFHSVALGVHENNAVPYAVWTTVGAISTVSHGVLLGVTLPLWLGLGIPVAVAESHKGIIEYPPASFTTLNIYARFPQGIPPGVTAAHLLGAVPAHSPAPAYPSLKPNAPPQ